MSFTLDISKENLLQSVVNYMVRVQPVHDTSNTILEDHYNKILMSAMRKSDTKIPVDNALLQRYMDLGLSHVSKAKDVITDAANGQSSVYRTIAKNMGSIQKLEKEVTNQLMSFVLTENSTEYQTKREYQFVKAISTLYDCIMQYILSFQCDDCTIDVDSMMDDHGEAYEKVKACFTQVLTGLHCMFLDKQLYIDSDKHIRFDMTQISSLTKDNLDVDLIRRLAQTQFLQMTSEYKMQVDEMRVDPRRFSRYGAPGFMKDPMSSNTSLQSQLLNVCNEIVNLFIGDHPEHKVRDTDGNILDSDGVPVNDPESSGVSANNLGSKFFMIPFFYTMFHYSDCDDGFTLDEDKFLTWFRGQMAPIGERIRDKTVKYTQNHLLAVRHATFTTLLAHVNYDFLLNEIEDILEEFEIHDECNNLSRPSLETYLVSSFYDFISQIETQVQIKNFFTKDRVQEARDIKYLCHSGFWKTIPVSNFCGLELPRIFVPSSVEACKVSEYDAKLHDAFVVNFNMMTGVLNTYVDKLRDLLDNGGDQDQGKSQDEVPVPASTPMDTMDPIVPSSQPNSGNVSILSGVIGTVLVASTGGFIYHNHMQKQALPEKTSWYDDFTKMVGVPLTAPVEPTWSERMNEQFEHDVESMKKFMQSWGLISKPVEETSWFDDMKNFLGFDKNE